MTREEIVKKEIQRYHNQISKQMKYQKEKQAKEQAKWKKEHCTSKEEYAKYLLNDKWLKRRDYIFNLRGAVCMHCGDTTRLHIHHIKYTGKYPWLAPDEDLICICEKCHKEIHSYEPDAFDNKDAVKLIEEFNNKAVDETTVLCFKGNTFIEKLDINDAAAKYQTKIAFIDRCCKGVTKTCVGFTWKYNK